MAHVNSDDDDELSIIGEDVERQTWCAVTISEDDSTPRKSRLSWLFRSSSRSSSGSGGGRDESHRVHDSDDERVVDPTVLSALLF